MKRLFLVIISALICGVVLTNCSSNNAKSKEEKVSDTIPEASEASEWWQPILQKHNLKLVAHNNFENVFVMGAEGNSINNGICTLKGATALIKNDTTYVIIKADSMCYDIEKRVFDIKSGVGNFYKMNCDSVPTMTFTGLTKVKVDTHEYIGNGAPQITVNPTK